MDTTAQQFRKEIAEKLQIEDASREMQEKIIQQVGSNIFKRITLRTAKELPETALDEYNERAEAGDIDALLNFIEKHIPNYDALVKEETDRVLSEL